MALGKLWKISYRDLARHRRRTWFTLIAVGLGLGLLILLDGYIAGVMQDSLETSIRLKTGHLQLRAPSYEEEKVSLKWENLLSNANEIAAKATALPEVLAAAPVLWATGILDTADESASLRVYGIEPESALYDPIRDGLVAGEYLQPDDRSGIMIGKRLADSLGVTAGQKVNLTVVNADGEADTVTFTIRGIYNTGILSYDDTAAFMPLVRAQALARTGDRASTVMVRLHDRETAEQVAAQLQAPDTQVLTWRELNSLFLETFETAAGFYKILDAIVMIIVAVIIANTLLMAVFERIREIGILSALGMKRFQVVIMFLLEATILALAGIVVGLILGSAGVWYLATQGIFIGDIASTVDTIPIGTTLYAKFSPVSMGWLSLWTLLIVLLASLYPAWYAARLEPVDALHAQ
ncbi:MAG: ABC transporter permease [Anaerolineales bacterium]|nr:ABC transporter permease [Anaerolineales bacterium]